jgi:putative ABC transport system permease protein
MLKEGGRAGTAGRARQRLRGALVAGEFALALVLLVGAGLSIRSLSRLAQVDPGFQPRGVMSGILSLPASRYKEDGMKLSFYRAVLEKLSSLPAVESAAAVMPLPFSGSNWSASFGIEGRQQLPGDPGPHGDVRIVSPRYFATLGIPILAGRAFTDQDREGSDPVAMIDTSLARQYWPNENPLGKRIRRGTRRPWATIVGVVGHVRHSELSSDSKGVYYFPAFQQALPFSALIIKSSSPSDTLAAAMRRVVSEVDPSQPVHDLKSMDIRVAESLGTRRFAVTLLGFFAVLAVVLAAIGIYGVISYSVTQRTQELGIRMALGAKRWQIFQLVLGQGMMLTSAGVLAGLLVSAYLVKWLSSQLFEVSRFDPLTFGVMAIILAIVAILACYIPALRATRVDPLEALRNE